MAYFYIHPPFYAFVFIAFYLLYVKKRFTKKQKRIYLGIGFVFFYTISTQFTLDFFASKIENKYPPISLSKLDKKSAYQIVILGAGYEEDVEFPATSKLNHIARARLLEGLRLYTNLPNSLIITSGYGGVYSNSTAKIMKDALVELGVSSDRIKMQETPVNTKEEAFYFKKHYSSQSKSTIIVTSALHMRRSKAWFNLAGVNVLTSSCDFQIHKDSPKSIFYFIPSTENWIYTEKIAKEYLGYLFVK